MLDEVMQNLFDTYSIMLYVEILNQIMVIFKAFVRSVDGRAANNDFVEKDDFEILRHTVLLLLLLLSMFIGEPTFKWINC